jgi:hypothetical protein
MDAAIADVSRIALMNSIDVIFRVIELKGLITDNKGSHSFS